MNHPPPQETVSDGTPSSAPLFEVEISVGHRAVDPDQGRVATSSRASAPTPLALQRQRRVKQRRQLFTIGALVIGLALSVWGTAAGWQAILQGNVVARVNGQPITMEQVDREIRLSKAISALVAGKEQAPAPPSMLEQLILVEMKVQAARRANMSLPPNEIDAEIAGMMKQANITPEKLDARLRSYGLTRDDLRASLSNTVLINRFVERYVVSGIADPRARLAAIDTWQNGLLQLARVERLRNPATTSAPRVGSQAPDFSLNDINGKEVKLSSLRGKTVMVNFWAPWCPPCRAEMPVLEGAYKAPASGPGQHSDFEILGVAIQSELPNVVAFVKEFRISFPVLMDSQNSATDLYQVGPIPTSFFVDKDGVVRAVQIGQMDAITLKERLDASR